MSVRNNVLRVCAIVFACAISIADGNATVLQSLANGWSPDAVYLVMGAVAFTNGGPTFIATAWGWGRPGLACILALGFLIGGAVSCTLTLQRIGAQIDQQQHATDRGNYPIALAEKELKQARKDAAGIPAKLAAAKSRHSAAVSKMDAALNDPVSPGKGPAYRRARDKRDAAAADVAEYVAAGPISIAKINELRDKLLALGPPKKSDFDGLGWLVAAAAALLAPVVSIGLFLFASSVPKRDRNVTELHTTANSFNQRRGDVTPAAVTSNDNEPCNVTADMQPDKTAADIGATKVADASSVMLGEAPRPTSHLPPKGSAAFQAAVVEDMLQAARKHGRMPSWSQCAARYELATATTTKYRKAALAQWAAIQSRQASAR